MADVHYTLAISDEALEQLRALPREQRRRIGARLTQLQDNYHRRQGFIVNPGR